MRACQCGHDPVDHHGTDPMVGCTRPGCDCDHTCTEAQGWADVGELHEIDFTDSVSDLPMRSGNVGAASRESTVSIARPCACGIALTGTETEHGSARTVIAHVAYPDECRVLPPDASLSDGEYETCPTCGTLAAVRAAHPDPDRGECWCVEPVLDHTSWTCTSRPQTRGEVGTGAGEGATGQDTGTAWVTRSADCPEAPAQAHLPVDCANPKETRR